MNSLPPLPPPPPVMFIAFSPQIATPATGSHGTADFQLQAFSQNI
jgi:hypothetical protein